MKNKYQPPVVILFIFIVSLTSAQNSYKEHWKIASPTSIVWDLEADQNLPHKDNIEMAGTKVAGIITYNIDTTGQLSLKRQIFFPQLHPFIKDNDPGWFIYRAYLKDTYSDAILPKLFIGNKQFEPGKVKSVQINGMLHFQHHTSKSGIALTRKLFPSMDERLFIENWTLYNTSDQAITISVGNTNLRYEDQGKDGKFSRAVSSCFPEEIYLAPGQSFSGDIHMKAKKEGEDFTDCTNDVQLTSRQDFLSKISGSLNLETPEPILNTLFEFSKIRASESIYDSKLGLIHSPGGGRYYVGIWANDQAEYVNPFFPFLGYEVGNISAMNTYRAFAGKMNAAYEALPYAFEVEEYEPPSPLDRGDAAMIAYGASQYALALGDKAIAQELWPLIQWCLEYNHSKLNKEGVVLSQSDEMEGRIETGRANLSTSSLYYGALRHATDLAESLGIPSSTYKKRGKRLKTAIERYFGSEVEGLHTYKYYKEHKFLRHWICLPLVVGIHERKEGTIAALFERLWTENGVHVEKNNADPKVSEVFWDRGTLYALRGTFLAGATEVSTEKLIAFSKQRLLGKRVPYVVEAFPEGNMAHLSAESGLYCRVLTEGLFGITPTGLASFTVIPRLPDGWNTMALRNVKAFGQDFDIEVMREGDNTVVRLLDNRKSKVVSEKPFKKDIPVQFNF
ncbi:six-hairpin glycosidase-like protein [Spongiimicrobium sp. 3-5]|uniref:six-hairpin glycosidase-like protein n=1 Tax=Spongiimicrobium sp. 3-5 TaxID=3332596 RepID=UPI00397F35E4